MGTMGEGAWASAQGSATAVEATIARGGERDISDEPGGSAIARSDNSARGAASEDGGGRSGTGTRLRHLADAETRLSEGATGAAPTSRNPAGIAADAAMERYATGDDTAFGAVYDEIAPRLYRYLLRQTRDSARAEDIVQSTLLHIHRARGSFILGSHVLPWAFAIARRVLIDELRRTRRDATRCALPVLEDMAMTVVDCAAAPLEAGELALALENELSRLPRSQQAAFELVRIDGLSHAEAAEALGVTVNSVKLRVHRAYSALKRVVAAR